MTSDHRVAGSSPAGSFLSIRDLRDANRFSLHFYTRLIPVFYAQLVLCEMFLAPITIDRNFSYDEWQLYFPGGISENLPDLSGPRDEDTSQ